MYFPPFPGVHVLAAPCATARALLCPRCLLKLPSSIRPQLLSSRGKQQLAAARLTRALELGLEASMLHSLTTAVLGTW